MNAPTAMSASSEFFLGRQPILDRAQQITAYELLFRRGPENSANVSDDVAASATVISHVFGELGVAAALGPHRGFINVSDELLLSDAIELLPREQIVLELLETVQLTPLVVARVRELHARGFTIALDDFTSDVATYEPVLDCVGFAKVDVLGMDTATLARVTAQLGRWPVKLLAEKVESREQAENCLNLGYELFQGYYFAKPILIAGRKLSPSELVLIKLLGLVLSDAETPAIEELFKHNPDLSLNLIRLANSVGAAARHPITSLRQAITLLGRRQIQRWLQLLLYACDRPGEAFPSPLLELAATRGRLMELLAAAAFPGKREAEDQAFMVGIMSLMDALLGMPLDDVLGSVEVPTDVRAALLHRTGRFGPLLHVVESLEDARGAAVANAIAATGCLSVATVAAAHTAALRWSSSRVPVAAAG